MLFNRFFNLINDAAADKKAITLYGHEPTIDTYTKLGCINELELFYK